jgi:peptidoglycan hydrolase-like protein with peptidoglycan-binding domain
MINRVLGLAVALCFVTVLSALADDNVRGVQTKLKEGGFYLGEIDGAYSSELSAALTRYQIRNGLPITGQLDSETSKALGAEPAVTSSSVKATTAGDAAGRSETWRRLRKKDGNFARNVDARDKAAARTAKMKAATADASRKTTTVAAQPAPPAEGPAVATVEPVVSERKQSGGTGDAERLRDYVGAFVLAGLDPEVGAEAEFFADRVQYYDDGLKDRDKIRQDLRRYDERWPDRKFWLAGDPVVDRVTDDLLRVRFPLRFELRNGEKHSSGKVIKTLVLQPAGDDFQIVGVNEQKEK